MQARLDLIIKREAILSTKSRQLKQRADAILNRRISTFSAYRQLEQALIPLKAAGYDVAAFRAAGCDWAIIKTANFTAAEVKAAGCGPTSAQSAGYELNSLVSAFGFDALLASGCDLSSVVLVSFPLCSCIHRRSQTNPPLPVTSPHPPTPSPPPPPCHLPLSAMAPTCT